MVRLVEIWEEDEKISDSSRSYYMTNYAGMQQKAILKYLEGNLCFHNLEGL